MEKLILFYDDTKPSCCRCISSFQKHENVECRKMSDNQDKTLIFATGAKMVLCSRVRTERFRIQCPILYGVLWPIRIRIT